MTGGGPGPRLKPVPEAPGDLEGLRDARRAVPLVPGTESDCCARLQDRLDLDSRDEARTWLTFLRALGLAAETRRGFARTREEFSEAALASALREDVYAVREVLAALEAAEDPLEPAAVFDRVEDVVPQWERHKDPDWRTSWRERTGRILAWTELLGLAEHVDGRYRPVEEAGP